jgi:hypothetical protein
VPILGGPDEVIVGDVEELPQVVVRSASSIGSIPWDRAAFSIFCPCSSVPVRK